MRRYRAKRDPWAVAILCVAAGVSLVAAVLVLASSRSTWVELVFSVVLAGAAVFILLLLLRTYYELGDDRLLVRHGLLRWAIPVKEIRSVSPIRSVASSAALSRDRLKISYGGGYNDIEIAPVDTIAFVSDLREMSPEIEVRGPGVEVDV